MAEQLNMRRRIKIVPAVLAGVAVCVVLLLILLPREPLWHGKNLDYWITQYDCNVGGDRDGARVIKTEEAELGIIALGTNALPRLVRMIGRKDSALKSRWIRFAKGSSLLASHVRTELSEHQEAVSAFRVLGKLGKPVLEDLVKIADDSRAKWDNRIIFVMSAMGAIDGQEYARQTHLTSRWQQMINASLALKSPLGTNGSAAGRTAGGNPSGGK